MYDVDHYKETELTITLQPIDICRELPFSLGCAVKYILRAGHKTDKRDTDLLKAIDYLKDFKRSIASKGYCYLSDLGNSSRAKLAVEEYCKRQRYISMLFHPNLEPKIYTDEIDSVITEILKEINEQK